MQSERKAEFRGSCGLCAEEKTLALNYTGEISTLAHREDRYCIVYEVHNGCKLTQ